MAAGSVVNKLAKYIAFFLMIFIALAVLVLMVVKFDTDLVVLDRISTTSTVIRLIVIAGVFIFWNPLIQYLGEKKKLSQKKIDETKDRRFVILILVLLVELFVMQNLPLKIQQMMA